MMHEHSELDFNAACPGTAIFESFLRNKENAYFHVLSHPLR
jgi:hypothetical protein